MWRGRKAFSLFIGTLCASIANKNIFVGF